MTFSTPTLEQRVEQLERDLTQLKLQIQVTSRASEEPWWEKIVGVFADDPDFEAATELGKDYRQSLKPNADTDE
jgi:thioredoxin-like negative regulator of GroEL